MKAAPDDGNGVRWRPCADHHGASSLISTIGLLFGLALLILLTMRGLHILLAAPLAALIDDLDLVARAAAQAAA